MSMSSLCTWWPSLLTLKIFWFLGQRRFYFPLVSLRHLYSLTYCNHNIHTYIYLFHLPRSSTSSECPYHLKAFYRKLFLVVWFLFFSAPQHSQISHYLSFPILRNPMSFHIHTAVVFHNHIYDSVGTCVHTYIHTHHRSLCNPLSTFPCTQSPFVRFMASVTPSTVLSCFFISSLSLSFPLPFRTFILSLIQGSSKLFIFFTFSRL